MCLGGGTMKKILRTIVVAAALACVPTAAFACCAAMAADLVWPWDGMEEVPLDAALVIYGNTYGEPLEDWSLVIESEAGGPAAFTSSVGAMEAGYFLVVATPEAPLEPDTEYNCAFTRDGTEGGMPMEFHFRTGVTAGEKAANPAPELYYEGLGVPMKEEDGSVCISSVTEEAGALALTVTGTGLTERPILIEAQDSQGVKVFDTVLSGKWQSDKQLTLGGGLCTAHFEVDPCEHYCVRAAALDHHGEPGPWSEWSCSNEIGYWVCGDPEGAALFGDDIPEGMTPKSDLDSCTTGGAPDADDSEEPGTETGSGTGCAVGRSSSTVPWSLVGFGILAMLLFVIRRRRPILRGRSPERTPDGCQRAALR